MNLKKALVLALPVAVAAGWLAIGRKPVASANTELGKTSLIVAPGRVEPLRDYQGLGRQAWLGVRFDGRGF